MTLEETSKDIPNIPDNSRFSYLNEGAANIVYRVLRGERCSTPKPSQIEEYGEGTPPPSEIDTDTEIFSKEDLIKQYKRLALFDNELLRLRKDLPTTRPISETQAAWERLIAPLFPSDQIVQQSLVRLPPSLVNELNNELRHSIEGGPTASSTIYDRKFRLPKRQGTYLANDEFGLLITDMTKGPYTGEEVIEFKPKWLVQSPSAPANSIRCRQCARVARANSERLRTGEPLQKTFCPLDLFHPDKFYRAAELILPSDSRDDQRVKSLVDWLTESTLLTHLRDLQLKLDPIGVLQNDAKDENFRLAMTLRDCTIFVRIPGPEQERHLIEARIGDLDLKSVDKAQYWRDTERALIDEGWYTGTEKEWQPRTCLLSPETEASSFRIQNQ